MNLLVILKRALIPILSIGTFFNFVTIVNAFQVSSSTHNIGQSLYTSTISTTTTRAVAAVKSMETRLAMSTSEGASSSISEKKLILYGSQGSRSPLVNWACLELNVPFQMASNLQMNPHPFGQLPCLVVDDNDGKTVNAVIFESGAILQYIQQQNIGQLTDAQLASILSWIAWANASLDPICFIETPEGKVYDTGLKNPNNKRLKQLDTILSKQQYLVSNVSGGFTIADVAVSSYLLYGIMFFPQVVNKQLVVAYPNIVRYMKDCVNRPMYGQAFGQQVQQNLSQNLDSVSTKTNAKSW